MANLTFDNWYGLWTRSSRGNRPIGALDQCDNLVFNTKSLKPSLRTGYANDTAYDCLASAPLDISDQTQLTTFRYPRGTYPTTETPTAQDIEVLAGLVTAAPHYFQRPFWHKNNATIESTEWMRYAESFSTTMSGKGTNSFDLDSDPSGYNTVTDELNGWVVVNTSRGNEQLTISDSTTGHVTTLEDLPSDWINTDNVTLYRSFHDNPSFSPSWTDPIVLKVGNNIVVSGGQGSTDGYKPIWSGYVNQAWFPDATRNPTYKQTYVCELELKNTNAWLGPQALGESAVGSNGLTNGKRYWAGFVWESWDGQRSNIFFPDTTEYIDGDDANKLTSVLKILYPLMDKRARYVHVFMAETDTTISGATGVDWANWFFVETHDMCAAASGFAYNNSTTVPAWFSKTIDLDLSDWNSVGSDLATFLGHTKPNRTTASFSYGLVTAGRLFVAKYYDYVAALNYDDSINYTPFAGNGVAQWAKLTDLDDQTQSTIESGDPASIQGLAVQDGRLVILKDTSSFYIDITYDPTSWILSDISRKIGCDAPDSIAVTPFGVIWVKTGDGVYLWRGGDPIEISRNWRVASDDGSTNLGFRGLTTTYKTQWRGWYDPFYRSYRLMYTVDGSALKTLYEAFLDVQDEKLQGLPIWAKHTLAHNCAYVLVRSDNAVFFSDGSTKTYIFSSLSHTDGETTVGSGTAGTDIRPYFHTGLYALTEKDIATVSEFSLSVYQAGSPVEDPVRELDFIVYIDGVAQNTFADNTYTATRFSSKLPLLGTSNRNRNGRTVAFAFNTNASPRGLGTDYRIEQLSIEYEVKKRAFSQSL